VKRNWESLVLKALGGKDFHLTLQTSEQVNPHYRRLTFDDGGLLTACPPHPTMWIRLWFDNHGKPHQRAYTLVDPNPAAGRFDLEFALHDGPAARWSQTAQPGDTIDATVQGSTFTLPDPAPARMFLVGDAASIPAINNLLDAIAGSPATILLEYAHDDEMRLPLRLRPDDTVIRIPRRDGGDQLVRTARTTLPADGDAYYWVSCEASSTRAITRHLRHTLDIPRRQISALGYWTAK
jgi:NADPH-dependent ferric siderophore reductase